jgi:hypothetical protein
MTKLLLSILLIGFLSNVFSQKEREVVDTIMISDDSVVVYADKSWEYLRFVQSGGVLNEHVHCEANKDSTCGFTCPWINDVTILSRENRAEKMKDTVWLCLVDSNYRDYRLPFNGPVTSTFKYRKGKWHKGIDIDLVTGDTVCSAFDGVVRYAKYNSGGFGNLVIVRHYNGLETYYAHLSEINVEVDSEVKAGDFLGKGGNTGHSYGSHLHFEVRFYDNALNPELVFNFKTGELQNENLLIHKGLFAYKGSGGSYSSGGKKYYKIRSGDTLGRIARRYGTSVSRICKLNGIKSTTILRIGKSIRVS